GDVQWMTAGAGVIHSEMPARDIMERGGKMHGFQIWVNLPREKKMTQPRYQEYANEKLPVVDGGGRWVRVIAGEFESRRSPIETTVPTTLLHVKLQPGKEAVFGIAVGSNAIVHVIDGAGTVEDAKVKKHDVAILEGAPTQLRMGAQSEPLEALVLAGVPLREPVARYGPFVMSNQEELVTEFEDF